MKDETYSYFSDVKARGQISRSARNRRTHNGKRGRVKLPSDYMTKKEINAMNGEVKSYRLNEPMSWTEFKAMPDDIQFGYIRLLKDKYSAPNSAIEKMFGIGNGTLVRHMNGIDYEVTSMKKGKFDREGWMAFVNRVPVKKEEEPAPEIEVEEPIPVAEEEMEEPVPEENACASLNYEAEYEKAMQELKKAECENNFLRVELRQREEEMKWLYGFKAAVEVIFGKENLRC